MLDPWTVALIVLLAPGHATLPSLSDDDREPGVDRMVPAEWVAFNDVVFLLDVDERRSAWWEEDFSREVDRCRARRLLLEDAPPAEDAGRLPSHLEAHEKLAFSSAHVEFLVTQAARHFGGFSPWATLAVEARALQSAWWDIKLATSPELHISSRRLCLRELREQLGPEAYYAGRWPPHVPLQYFRDSP